MFLKYNVVSMSVHGLNLHGTILRAEDLLNNRMLIGFVMMTAKRMPVCEFRKVDTGENGERYLSNAI